MESDLRPVLSHGERLLFDAARDLFYGEAVESLSLRELATTLDGDSFNVLCEALIGFRSLFLGCEF